MQPSHTMNVTDLKNKLLEVVRRVEQGEIFEITKDGKAVAILAPRHNLNRSATGFARIGIRGDRLGEIDPSESPWTYDVENLKVREPTSKRKR